MDELPAGAAVGVVGEHPSVVDAVAAAGGDPVADDAAAVLDSDPVAVVAVGEDGLVDLARAGVDVPVLPVAAGRGVRSVPEVAVEPAVARLVAGDADVVDHPVHAVDGGVALLFDLVLVTDGLARISEYVVRADGEDVGRVRADGVVLATPAGSVDYARAAGGPVVAPGTGVGAVVPIAPFATDQDDWVLPLTDVELAVARDDTPVKLVVDGRRERRVGPDEWLELERRGRLRVAVLPESQAFFARP